MKPFDIELAKAGAKVITRDGQNVYIDDFQRMHPGPDMKLVPLIMGRIGGGIIELWSPDGKIRTDGQDDPLDLMLA